MKIGSHVSNNGNLMLVGSVQEALINQANCLMVYLGAPQNTFRKNAIDFRINEMHDLLTKNNISLEDVIIHAPYIVNLAQPNDEKWQFAIDFLTAEIKLTAQIGAKYYVLHPGAHVGMGTPSGIKRIASGIKKIIEKTSTLDVVITLETMSGKGTECGKTFEEISEILTLVNNKERMGVCLDTCHINDAGYDLVNNYEGIWDDFNHIIGLDYLKVIHLNDSKNKLGAKKDRHENIGFGYIGFEPLLKVVHDERFLHVPKILETPYLGEGDSISPYRDEIIMLKAILFNANFKEQLIKAS